MNGALISVVWKEGERVFAAVRDTYAYEYARRGRTYLEDWVVVSRVRASSGGDKSNRERYASHRDNTKDRLE